MIRRVATAFLVGSMFVAACGSDNDGAPLPSPSDAGVDGSSHVSTNDSGTRPPLDSGAPTDAAVSIEAGADAAIDSGSTDAGKDADADAGAQDADAGTQDAGLTGSAVFFLEYLEASGSGLTTCCPGSTFNAASIAKLYGTQVDQFVKDGRLVHDAAKEKSCLDAITYTTAECPVTGPAPQKKSPICDQVYGGLVAEGNACSGDLECKSGLPCQGKVCKAATTVAGGDCDFAEMNTITVGAFSSRKRCIDGERCYLATKKCGPRYSTGQTCRDDLDCLDGLYCKGVYPNPTSCQPIVKQPIGASCENDLNCDTNLTCLKVNSADEFGNCTARKNAGETCTQPTNQTECYGACSQASLKCVAFCGSN